MAFFVVLGLCWASARGGASVRRRFGSGRANIVGVVSTGYPTNLLAVLTLDPAELRGVDIGVLNLLCSEGLEGIGRLDRREALATLDLWAGRVKAETDRHLYRFQRNPAEFERSEGFFRVLMLAVVLAED